MSVKLTRRGLLKSAAAAAAAPYVVASSALGLDGAVPPSSRITMGCIGVGGQGFGVDTAVFLASGDCQILAICDVDAGHRKRAKTRVEETYAKATSAGTYQGCTEHNDFREILAREDIDAVMIATPDHWHALISIAAAHAGKHIYCEKPVSLTIAQGQAVAQTMRRSGVVYQSGTQRRSVGHFRLCCELVRSGRIGRLRKIIEYLGEGPSIGPQKEEAVPPGFDYEMWLGPAPHEPYTASRCHGNFRWNWDYAGGKITDQGAHFLDIAQWANDTESTGPVEIEGAATFPTEGIYNTPIQYKAVCTYANGVQLEVIHPLIENDWAIRFEGTDGWLMVARSRLYAERPSLMAPLGPNDVHLYRSSNHQQNFLDCVKTRRPNASPADISHRSVTVCHLCNIALRLGRKLRWNPDREEFVGDEDANRMIARGMRAPWHL